MTAEGQGVEGQGVDGQEVDGRRPVVIDRSGVANCFGCGQGNAHGLKLRFEQLADGTVETRHRPSPDHCGLDTVVHGGIQAAILDEVMGIAAQLALPPDASDLACITIEMNLRFRRPVPIDGELLARATVDRIDERDTHVTGQIVGADGEALTVATSRWRQLQLPS